MDASTILYASLVMSPTVLRACPTTPSPTVAARASRHGHRREGGSRLRVSGIKVFLPLLLLVVVAIVAVLLLVVECF